MTGRRANDSGLMLVRIVATQATAWRELVIHQTNHAMGRLLECFRLQGATRVATTSLALRQVA